jgi:hypothetical protein
MKCPVCGGQMQPLFISWVCDQCDKLRQAAGPTASLVMPGILIETWVSLDRSSPKALIESLAKAWTVLERQNLRVTHLVIHPKDLDLVKRHYNITNTSMTFGALWGAEVVLDSSYGGLARVQHRATL